MGIEKMHPPKYWEMRAEEFRAKSDKCEHKQVKESLRKIANTYDGLRVMRPPPIGNYRIFSECSSRPLY